MPSQPVRLSQGDSSRGVTCALVTACNKRCGYLLRNIFFKFCILFSINVAFDGSVLVSLTWKFIYGFEVDEDVVCGFFFIFLKIVQ